MTDDIDEVSNRPDTIGQLEAALLGEFPASQAADWDRTGLIVGDPDAAIEGIAVALDPTVSAVRRAKEAGANVLVTHHPPFFNVPSSFKSAASVAIHDGANVFEAARLGVALICCHTALDFDPLGWQVMPDILGFQVEGLLEEMQDGPKRVGYGAICRTGGMSLSQLADRCVESFNSGVRVWGDPDATIERVVTGSGAASSLKDAAVQGQVDCLVVGEMKYHVALDLAEAGIATIELSHDVSELPFADLLADRIASFGIKREDIRNVSGSSCWYRM